MLKGLITGAMLVATATVIPASVGSAQAQDMEHRMMRRHMEHRMEHRMMRHEMRREMRHRMMRHEMRRHMRHRMMRDGM